MEKASKFIREYLHNVPGWISRLNKLDEYNSTRFDKEISSEEMVKIIYEVVGVLKDFSDIAIKYGSFKDSFDNSKMYLTLYGPTLIIKSNKTNIEFHLSADDEGISLESNLSYIENINYMDDLFWKDLLKLSDLGKFSLENNEFYPKEITKKHSSFYSSDNSIVFRILRSYFVGTTEKAEDIFCGSLKITWIPEHALENILDNYCKAFKILYKLNYNLWKITDLKSKKKK